MSTLKSQRRAFSRSKMPLVFLGLLVVYAIVVSLVSILAFKLPAVSVCIIVILEAVLAVCLNKIPIWIHGLVVIAQIVAGILSGQIVFMILAAIMYIISISVLFVLANHE